MKRYAWGFPLVAVALLTFTSSSRSRPVEEANASQNGAAPSAVTLLRKTRGVMLFTAAINSNGTVASGYNVVAGKTLRLSTGQYQVVFAANVQATNGASRWVRPDTLTAGTTHVWCDTADRVGVPSGIFVNCQTAAGFTDSAFFLFVAK